MVKRHRRQFQEQELEIDMEDRFKQLDSESEHKDTVLSFLPHSMFKVGDFMLAAITAYQSHGLTALKQQFQSRGAIPGAWDEWSGNGVACEILSPGNNGWQRGKVRMKVTLEFCPDELEVPEIAASNNPEVRKIESPLDDIRQMMNQDS